MPNVPRGTPKAPCELCGQLTASRFGVCKRTPECSNEYESRQRAEPAARKRAVEGVRRWRARPENRDRVLEYSRKYRQANPEQEAERHRRYTAENREQDLERKRRYRTENQEITQEYERRPERRQRKREIARRYAAIPENRERHREYGRRYRAETRDRTIERRREIRAAHPERHRAANRRYFQREDRPCADKSDQCSSEFAIRSSIFCRAHKNADSARRHKRRRDKTLRRHAEAQGWICTWCGLRLPDDLSNAHLDHIIPRAVLVIEDDWNFDALHGKCNLEKWDRLTERAVALAAKHGIDLKAHPARQPRGRGRHAA